MLGPQEAGQKATIRARWGVQWLSKDEAEHPRIGVPLRSCPKVQVKKVPALDGIARDASTSQAGVGLWSAAGCAKEPGEIWRSVLSILAKVVDAACEIAELEDTTIVGVPSAEGARRSESILLALHAIEGIESRACRWHGAAGAVGIARTGLRGQHICFKLQNGIAVPIVRATVGGAAR